MKRWMQIVLTLSLAFNFGFLGAFIYRLIEKPSKHAYPPLPKAHHGAPQPVHESMNASSDNPVFGPEQRRRLHETRQAFRPRMFSLRQELAQERQALGELLIQGESDSTIIDSCIQSIGALEMRMEKEVIFELLREAQVLAPEERAPFILMALRRIEGNKLRQQSPPNRPTKQSMRPRKDFDKQLKRRNQP